jgi:hypothetical protein
MTQPPFRQGYQPLPPKRRSNGPIIALFGCGGLAVLAVVIIVVALIARNPATPIPRPTYTPYSYSPPTVGDGIPDALGGIWSGTITNAEDGGTTTARIVLLAGLSTGSVSYTDSSTTCSGLLTVQESTSTKVTLRETITTGRTDCPDGYMMLYPGGSTTRYEWRENRSDTTPSWRGTLTKQ